MDLAERYLREADAEIEALKAELEKAKKTAPSTAMVKVIIHKNSHTMLDLGIHGRFSASWMSPSECEHPALELSLEARP